jgi:hypothetical protein
VLYFSYQECIEFYLSVRAACWFLGQLSPEYKDFYTKIKTNSILILNSIIPTSLQKIFIATKPVRGIFVFLSIVYIIITYE